MRASSTANLVKDIHADNFRENLLVDIRHRAGNAFAHIAFFITVAKLNCFFLAG